MEKYQEQIEKIYDLIVAYGLKVLMAIIVLVIGPLDYKTINQDYR